MLLGTAQKRADLNGRVNLNPNYMTVGLNNTRLLLFFGLRALKNTRTLGEQRRVCQVSSFLCCCCRLCLRNIFASLFQGSSARFLQQLCVWCPHCHLIQQNREDETCQFLVGIALSRRCRFGLGRARWWHLNSCLPASKGQCQCG